MRKILVLTGSRSDYGILKPVIQTLNASRKFDTRVLITGTHLLKESGRSIDAIKQDGFKLIQTKPVVPRNLDNYGMALTVGRSVIEVAKLLNSKKPDILLLLGDRVEVLGGAVAAVYLNIPLAHIHGGDRSSGGHIDDYVRHAITKLSHIHFAVTKKSAERIKRLGEEKWRVFNVGSPSIDFIKKLKFGRAQKKAIFKRLDFNPSKELLIVLYNPITTESIESARGIKLILDVIAKMRKQTVVIYPNMDAGSGVIMILINKYRKSGFIRVVPNLDHETFIRLMKSADLMIGNSSSGFIEAPSCGLAFIHVGNRQKDREHAENVINVKCDSAQIYQAIKKALYDRKFKEKVSKCRNPYGDGSAAAKIAGILSKIKLDKKLIQKKITY